MYATVGSQSHEMNALSVFFRVRESRNDFGVLQDAVVSTCAVDFHQILINHTSGTNVEVTYFRVTHLSVGQTYVLTTCLKLGMRIIVHQIIPVRSGSVEDYVVFLLVT